MVRAEKSDSAMLQATSGESVEISTAKLVTVVGSNLLEPLSCKSVILEH